MTQGNDHNAEWNTGSIGCPSIQEWRLALYGQVPGPRLAAVEHHLLACSDCELTVDALTEQSDTFVRELCRQPSTSADEPAFRAMYANLVRASESGFSQFDSVIDPALSALPLRLGNYELLSPLGHGASGSVFLARHVPLARQVAIKLLRPDHDFDRSKIDRFMREIRAVAQLDHPHLIRATDAGETDGRHFLAMEYVPGLDLSSVIASCPPLRWPDACEIARQAALGIAYLHQNGFVHRDIKPSNLLLTGDGQIKLLDLGLVQSRGRDSQDAPRQPTESETHDSETHGDDPVGHEADNGRFASDEPIRWPAGTPDYMPPEQWEKFDTFDDRSDLYSLGCSLYKLLTGAPPFRPLPDGYADRCQAHCHAPPPRLASLRADCPAELQSILDRLLDKKPAGRFEHAEEVVRRLQPLCQDADLAALADQMGLQSSGNSVATATSGDARGIHRRQALLWGALGFGGLAGIFGLTRVLHETPEIQLDVWRSLVAEDPPVLLKNPGWESAILPTAPDEFSVTSSESTLVNLGRPLKGTFRVTVDISQSQWRGGAGLFFAYRRATDDKSTVDGDGPVRLYQSIELIQHDDREATGDNSPAYRLAWRRFRADHSPKDRRWRTVKVESLASVDVEVPEDGQSQTLELQLGIAGFPRVFWGGQEYPQTNWMVERAGQRQAAVPANVLDSQFLGLIGLISSGGATIFRQPKLAYIQRESANKTRSQDQ